MKSCAGHAPHGLPYVVWHEDAEQRAIRGQNQEMCDECGRWSWPSRPAKGIPRSVGQIAIAQLAARQEAREDARG